MSGITLPATTLPPLRLPDAACRGVDPNVFFPQGGEDQNRGKRICAGCPCRRPCLEYALANGEHYGIWGGASERQRRIIRRMRAVRRVA